MHPFTYCRIGRVLQDQIKLLLRRGESVALLGSNQVGKRYLTARLLADLREDPNREIIVQRCKMLQEVPPDRPEPHGDDPPQTAEEFVQKLRDVFEAPGNEEKSTLLVLTNLDAIPLPYAREILVSLQRRVHEEKRKGRLTVLLTGERDLGELVHGPNSAFRAARPIVIQGFDREEFETYTRSLLQNVPVDIDLDDGGVDRLYRRTGGNTFLLRLLLWRYCEKLLLQPMSDRDFASPSTLLDLEVEGGYGVTLLRRVDSMLAFEPDAWERLEKLLNGEPLPTPGPAPTLLELSGVATREGRELRIASPVMHTMLRRTFTARYFADLCMRAGRTADALERYERLSPSQRLRPLSVDDLPSVHLVVRCLQAELGRLAFESRPKLRDLFVRACTQILGIEAITFWRFRGEGHWSPLEIPGLPQEGSTELGDRLRSDAELILPDRIEPSRVLEIPKCLEHVCVAATLESLRDDQQCAVVIGCSRGKRMFTRSGIELLETLVDGFRSAHVLATKRMKSDHAEAVRRRHSHILRGIVSSLGDSVRSVRDVLNAAARLLKAQAEGFGESDGYRRAFFSLVSEDGTQIRGLPQEADCDENRIAGLTDFPLDGSSSDIQPRVVREQRPHRIREPRDNEHVNSDVIKMVGLGAFAVIPVIAEDGTVLGTLHVERTDGEVPSEAEVEQLLELCEQLATLMEHGRRIRLTNAALDSLPEALVIWDRAGRLRYANEPASSFFEVSQPGVYATAHLARKRSEWLLEEHRPWVPEWGASGYSVAEKRSNRFIESKNRHGERVRAEVLEDVLRTVGRDESIGGVCRILPLDKLFRVLDAFQKITEAKQLEQATQNVLAASRCLGHDAGRLYRLERRNGDDVLVGQSYYFLRDGKVVTESFADAPVILRPGEDRESWRCIDREEPIVFEYDPDAEDRRKRSNPRGLWIENTHAARHCPSPFEKHPKDMWIDVPLRTADRVIGKLTLQCPADYGPGEFEVLRVFSNLVSELLQNSIGWETEQEERAEEINESARSSTSQVCHTLRNRISALLDRSSSLRHLLQELPDGPGKEKIERWARNFDTYRGRVQVDLDRAERMLRELDPQLREVDLHRFLQEFARSHGEVQIIRGEGSEFATRIDVDSFTDALEELVQNSRHAIGDRTMRVSMKITGAEGRAAGPSLHYSDNGPGIAPEIRDRVFDPGFTGREGGLGLGSYHVRRVMRLMGGDICVARSKEAGAQFDLRFPPPARPSDVSAHSNSDRTVIHT